jgi:hypothetical protein
MHGGGGGERMGGASRLVVFFCAQYTNSGGDRNPFFAQRTSI